MPTTVGLTLFGTLAISVVSRIVLAGVDMAQSFEADSVYHRLLENVAPAANLIGGFAVMTEWHLTMLSLKYTTNTFERGIFGAYQHSVVIPSQAAFALVVVLQLVVVCTSESVVTMPVFIAAFSVFMALGSTYIFFRGIKPDTIEL